MTNKVSLDKSKIKFVLLEGVHQSALDTLHAAGYTNIDFYKKALDGDELTEAIKDAHFIGLMQQKCVGFRYLMRHSPIPVLWLN